MQSNLQNKNLYWINAVKAVCMICVYWAHSEVYCPVTSGFSIMPWIGPFYVNAFFIVSGYLFFYGLTRAEQSRAEQSRAEQSRAEQSRAEQSRAEFHTILWHKFYNVVFKLMIPTIIFSSLIFIPKFLFHASGISIQSYCYYVLGGISFWFTSALVVTQLVMILLCFLFGKRLLPHFLASLFLLAVVFFLHPRFPFRFPWYWQSGLAGCFLFVLGGIYYRFEGWLGRDQKYLVTTALLVLLLIAGSCQCSPSWVMMGCSFNLSGFDLMAASSLLLFQLMKFLPQLSILDYIGRNSIIFYFFAGVCPALCGTLWRKFLPGVSNYPLIFAVIVVELLLAYGVSVCFNKFLPFLLDLRKISFKRI